MKLHDLILINVLVPCEKHMEIRPGSWSKVALKAAEGCNCYSVPPLIFNIPHTEKSSLGFLSPPFCFSSCLNVPLFWSCSGWGVVHIHGGGWYSSVLVMGRILQCTWCSKAYSNQVNFKSKEFKSIYLNFYVFFLC